MTITYYIGFYLMQGADDEVKNYGLCYCHNFYTTTSVHLYVTMCTSVGWYDNSKQMSM